MVLLPRRPSSDAPPPHFDQGISEILKADFESSVIKQAKNNPNQSIKILTNKVSIIMMCWSVHVHMHTMRRCTASRAQLLPTEL